MQMRRLYRGLQQFLLVLLAAAVLATISVLARQVVGQENFPRVFGLGCTVVLTGSMEPAIAAGDLVIIRAQPPYGIDDIVTFNAGQSFVTHRIIALEGDLARTKGDGNNVADTRPVSLGQIEGKVIWRLPRAGKLILFLKQPSGLMLLFGLGVLVLAIPCLCDRRRAKK